MNRKAVLGKILTSVFVMLFIVILLGIYLTASAGLAIFKGFDFQKPVSVQTTTIQDALFFETIEFIEDGQPKKELIIDSAVKWDKNGIEWFVKTNEDNINTQAYNAMQNALKNLVTSEKPCNFITITNYGPIQYTQRIEIGYAPDENGLIEEKQYYNAPYKPNNIDTYAFQGKNNLRVISSYYGECMEDIE